MKYGYREGDGLLNECGVCMRPYTETIDLMDGFAHGTLEDMTISLVETPDGHWLEGACVCSNLSGMCYAPSISQKAHSTKKRAIEHAWQGLERYIIGSPHEEHIRRRLASVLGECDQLSLF